MAHFKGCSFLPHSYILTSGRFALIALLAVLFISAANADRIVYSVDDPDPIPDAITGDPDSGDLELNAKDINGVHGQIQYTGTVSDVSDTIKTNLYATGTWGTTDGGRVSLKGDNLYTGISTVECYVLIFNGNKANAAITSAGFDGPGKVAFLCYDTSTSTGRNMSLTLTADPSEPQPHTGYFQINGQTRLYFSSDANLSNSTLKFAGGSSTANYTEASFNTASKNVSFKGVTCDNQYVRILNVNGGTSAETLNTISFQNGTFSGQMGRYGSGSDVPGGNTAFVNYFYLTKASDGTENGGTLTLSGPVYYKGATKIEGGTLEITNSDFVSTSSLTGSGTLKLSGHDKHFNIDSSDASEFTGTIQLFDDSLTSNGRIIMAATTYSWKNKALQTSYSASNISLPNATLEMNGSSKGFSELGFYTGNSSLTIGTLNGNEYSRILKANNNSTEYCNLTVSEGNYAGEIGRHYFIPQDEGPDGAYCFVNHINLIKVNDGTLTLSGKNYFFGTTTVSGGTLKLTADAVVTTGLVSVESNGTLEYNVADGETKLLTITGDNAISSTGTIKKTGDGTLQILTEAANLVSASSWVVSSGRMDMKEFFKGSLEIGENIDGTYTTATFSPGNSVGDLTITGDLTINPGSTLLYEFDEEGVDTLQVTGTTTFGENTFIALALEEGASPSPNQQLTIQLPDNMVGFDNVTFTYPSYLNVTYDETTGVLSATVDANAVPEPSTWALLIIGAAGLMYWRKRK